MRGPGKLATVKFGRASSLAACVQQQDVERIETLSFVEPDRGGVRVSGGDRERVCAGLARGHPSRGNQLGADPPSASVGGDGQALYLGDELTDVPRGRPGLEPNHRVPHRTSVCFGNQQPGLVSREPLLVLLATPVPGLLHRSCPREIREPGMVIVHRGPERFQFDDAFRTGSDNTNVEHVKLQLEVNRPMRTQAPISLPRDLLPSLR